MKNEELVDEIACLHVLLRRFTTRYTFTGRALVILHLEDVRRKLVAANLEPCETIETFMSRPQPRTWLHIGVFVAREDLTPDFFQLVQREGYARLGYLNGRHARTPLRLYYVEFLPDPKWNPRTPMAHVPLLFAGSIREIPTHTLTDAVEAPTRQVLEARERGAKVSRDLLEDFRLLGLAQAHVERLKRPMMFELNVRAWQAEIPRLCDADDYHRTGAMLLNAITKEADPPVQSVQELAQWLAHMEGAMSGAEILQQLEDEYCEVIDLLLRRFELPYDEYAMRPSAFVALDMKNEDLVDEIINIHLLLSRAGARNYFSGRALVVLHLEVLRRKLAAAHLEPCPAVDEYLSAEQPRRALNFTAQVAESDLTPSFFSFVASEGYRLISRFDGRNHYSFYSGGDRHFYVEFIPDAGWTRRTAPRFAQVPLLFAGREHLIPTQTLVDVVEGPAGQVSMQHALGGIVGRPLLEDLRVLVLAQAHVERLNRPMMFGLNAREWQAEIPLLYHEPEYRKAGEKLVEAFQRAGDLPVEGLEELSQWLARMENGMTGPKSLRLLGEEWFEVIRLLVRLYALPYDEHASRPITHRRCFSDPPFP
ncbi:hypothetical protein JCM10450v2_001616 [Rhodotorula kratochvilovae]